MLRTTFARKMFSHSFEHCGDSVAQLTVVIVSDAVACVNCLRWWVWNYVKFLFYSWTAIE